MVILNRKISDELAESVSKLYKLEQACAVLDEAKIKYEPALDICFDLMSLAANGGRMERKMLDLSIRDAARRIRESISWIPTQADIMQDYKKTPSGSLKLCSYIYKAVKPFAEKEFEG
ncbi:hypothetical protein KG088_14275 [Halomonas sp. TRM85114]|uniref:hypothetical protein n=1 Tax=Halomonas jincaotanensis TaxID=2810616 RepID=UPI001BD53A82|nr:hypothetical protein [Halomonas jincaotanensis]MBS9404802.1 hypothetical protein [Halomonas jincaotanensis]